MDSHERSKLKKMAGRFKEFCNKFRHHFIITRARSNESQFEY
jgi:hypothetical protein